MWFHKEFFSHISFYGYSVGSSLKLFCYFKHVFYCGLFTAFKSSVWKFAKSFAKRPSRRCSFFLFGNFSMYKTNVNSDQAFFLMFCIFIMCLAAQTNTGYYWKDMHYYSTYATDVLESFSKHPVYLQKSFAHSNIAERFQIFDLIRLFISRFLLMKRMNWYLLI